MNKYVAHRAILPVPNSATVPTEAPWSPSARNLVNQGTGSSLVFTTEGLCQVLGVELLTSCRHKLHTQAPVSRKRTRN